MSDIFLSYRRRDVAGTVGRLADGLRRAFGEQAVYRDVDSERAGRDWKKSVTRNVSGARVVLALIGPRWAGLLAERDPEAPDWTRFELSQARALDVPVVPVLVEGATPEALPAAGDLAWLCDIQCFMLGDGEGRWEADLARLVAEIESLSGLRAAAAGEASAPAGDSQVSHGDQSPNVQSGGGAVNISFGKDD